MGSCYLFSTCIVIHVQMMLIHLDHCDGTCPQSTNTKEINYSLRNMRCYIWCMEVITWFEYGDHLIYQSQFSLPVQDWLEAKWRYWKLLWTYNDRSKASPSFSCWAQLLQVKTWMWYKTLHLQKNNLICSEMFLPGLWESANIFRRTFIKWQWKWRHRKWHRGYWRLGFLKKLH